MDATLQWRADHSHRRDSAVAARQYRPARRRNSRSARPCFHSRFHRYSHALRHSARLYAHAVFRGGFQSLRRLSEQHKTKTGWWANFDKYIVSLLKAYYGDAATKENDYGFDWLPRVTGDHSHLGYWLDMADGKIEGLFVMGQNPAVGAPNSRLGTKSAGQTEMAGRPRHGGNRDCLFLADSPEIARGELNPEKIETEVFLFPAAGHAEKDGCFTNTQRLNQFHEKAVDPPGDARSETWFMYHLGRRLKEKAADDPRPRNAGLNALTWDYPMKARFAEPEVEEILQEINGWTVGGPQTGRRLSRS